MEILTGTQMRLVDRRAIDELGLPSLQLMEAAGRGVAERLLVDYPDAPARTVVVICGRGNNGGDGLVAARHLARRGIVPRVLLLAGGNELSGDAAVNLQAARAAGVDVHEIRSPEDWSRERGVLKGRPVVLDAILGTGVRGGARGLAATVIEELNTHGGDVVAVDLPSGIDADLSTLQGCVVRARHTYTLCRPKLPLVLGPGAALAGSWHVIPIGIPDAAVAAAVADCALEWFDADAATRLLEPRSADSHKGTYGHLLAIAGSRGKSGAAVLVARAALRSGVGLVTVASARSLQDAISVQQAEVMTEPLAEAPSGGPAAEALDCAIRLAATRQAVAVGPGIGTEPSTALLVRGLLERCGTPMVIDADGLNALAPLTGPVPRRPDAGDRVLTPHPGEGARLLGCTAGEVQADRLDAARRLARAAAAVVVLKGHRTLTAHPDGRVAVNASGNPGMATAGAGDVLTGVLGACLARGRSSWDAARLAVFVHGDAGDRAAAALGEDGMIASDLVDHLPAAQRALRHREHAT
jgi:NAD(P)H-hydrate epimerase